MQEGDHKNAHHHRWFQQLVRSWSCATSYALSDTTSHSNFKSDDAVQYSFAEGPAPIKLQPAPQKRVERMRDKISKYGSTEAASGWPRAARILDPVRASIVCEGASQMLQVVLKLLPVIWIDLIRSRFFFLLVRPRAN